VLAILEPWTAVKATLEAITLLDASEEGLALAQELIRTGAIPATSPEDAAHVALAVVDGVAYLVTWNCRHLANASMRTRIEAVCREQGYEPATIRTPEGPMEADDGHQ
jgi:hypothetical protein